MYQSKLDSFIHEIHVNTMASCRSEVIDLTFVGRVYIFISCNSRSRTL